MLVIFIIYSFFIFLFSYSFMFFVAESELSSSQSQNEFVQSKENRNQGTTKSKDGNTVEPRSTSASFYEKFALRAAISKNFVSYDE